MPMPEPEPEPEPEQRDTDTGPQNQCQHQHQEQQPQPQRRLLLPEPLPRRGHACWITATVVAVGAPPYTFAGCEDCHRKVTLSPRRTTWRCGRCGHRGCAADVAQLHHRFRLRLRVADGTLHAVASLCLLAAGVAIALALATTAGEPSLASLLGRSFAALATLFALFAYERLWIRSGQALPIS